MIKLKLSRYVVIFFTILTISCMNDNNKNESILLNYQKELLKMSNVPNSDIGLLSQIILKEDSLDYFLTNAGNYQKKENDFYNRILSSINPNIPIDSTYYFSFIVFTIDGFCTSIEIVNENKIPIIKRTIFRTKPKSKPWDSIIEFENRIISKDSMVCNSEIFKSIDEYLLYFDFWNLKPVSYIENFKYDPHINGNTLYIKCIQKWDENRIMNHRIERYLTRQRKMGILEQFINILPTEYTKELKYELE